MHTNSSISRVFILKGTKDPLSPEMFGLAAVKLAIDTTVADVEEMLDNSAYTTQHKIIYKPTIVHFHLIALTTAVFCVYASKLTSSSREILAEITKGVSNGFTNLLLFKGLPLKGEDIARFLYDLFQMYFVSLANEFNEIGKPSYGDNPFSMGATATLVAKNIAIHSDVEDLLEENSVERYRLERIAVRNGMLFLAKALEEELITYQV